jgi:PAS domain S-box-containing protein
MKSKNNNHEQTVELRKKAEKIVREKAAQSSEKLETLSPEETQQTLHELRVHQIELEMQNEELRRVQVNLDEAMERYFDLYNLAPVGYFTINEKGLIIEANLTFATLLDVEKNTLIKKPFTHFILPDDQDVFYNHHKQIIETDTDGSQGCELRMVKKDGTQFWVHLESTTALENNGEQVYRVVMSDITERKKADEIISQSEEKFRKKFSTLFDDAPAGIALVDKNGIIQEVNNNLLQLLSLRKEELIGSSFVELAPAFGLDAKENITDFKKRLAEAPSKREITFLNKNNKQTTITVQSSVIKSGDETHGILYILHDITERKKAEDQLKNSEERYKNLIELAPDSIITINLKGYITSCNTAATRIFSYSRDDLVGKHFAKIGILHVKDVPKYLKVFVSLLQGKSTGIYELTVKDKDGTSRIAETHIGLIKENNKITGILAITRDITERKRTEENLKNSLEQLIFAQKAAKTGFWDWDMKTGKLTWSKEFFELFGLPSDAQPTFDTWRKVLHPNDRKRAEEKIYRSIEDKISLDNEYRIILSDGKERWIRAQGDTFYDYSGNPQRMGGICIDITKQKQMEDGLKQIERELNKAQQIAHVGSWVWDIKNQTITWTDELYRIYGVDKDFVLTFDNIVSMIHPEDREKNAVKVKELLESATTLEYEFRIIRPDTSIRHIFQSIEVSRDSTRKPLRAIGIMQDITERKKAEEALGENQEKYRLITENTNDLITITNTDKTFRYVSPSITSLGYTPDELIGKDSFILLHPEDNIRITSMLKQLVTGSYKPGTSSRFEYRLRDKSGGYHLFETTAKLVKDESGKLGILSTSRDITERKKAEEKIKIFSDAIASAFDYILLTDVKGNITFANESAIDAFGYTSEEFLKLNIAELDTDPVVAKKIIEEMAVKGRWSGEVTNIRKNKDKFPAILSAFIIKDEKGNSIGTMGIIRDITERKQTEEALRESQKRFQALTETTNDFVWEMDTNGVYTYCSPQINELWGYKPEEMIGRTPFDVMVPKNRENAIKMFRSMSKSPRAFQGLESSSWDKTGRIVILETSGVPFFDIDGKLRGYRGISRDITERKRAEENLRKNE